MFNIFKFFNRKNKKKKECEKLKEASDLLFKELLKFGYVKVITDYEKFTIDAIIDIGGWPFLKENNINIEDIDIHELDEVIKKYDENYFYKIGDVNHAFSMYLYKNIEKYIEVSLSINFKDETFYYLGVLK